MRAKIVDIRCIPLFAVLDFKINLEKFKSQSVNSSFYNFWEVTNMIIDKIEGNPRYLENKNKFNSYTGVQTS